MKVKTLQLRQKRVKAGWLSVLWIAAALSAATVARADIFFWEDDEGVIHFSNQDVPPKAALYMREPAPSAQPEPIEEERSIDRDALAADVARQQAENQARLEEANRKLNRALEKVDELTESVSQSRSDAAAAAEAARQAELEAEAARNYQSDIKERVVVHTVPNRRHYSYRDRHTDYGVKYRRHRFKHRQSRHLDHKQKFKININRDRSKLHKFKRDRHRVKRHRIPSPILPPERSRIPRAYGIR